MSDEYENDSQATTEETPVYETAEDTTYSSQEEPVQEAPEQEPVEETEETISETSTELVPVETSPAEKPSKLKEIHIGSLLDALKAMISFFTIIPLSVGEKECNAMERNFWIAPLLGVVNGFIAFIVCLIVALCGVGTLVQAAVAIAAVFILSKFLHFDGLADFGDGIVVSSGKQEDHVRALKDSLIGAGGFGVALTVTMITVVCLSAIGGTAGAALLPDGQWIGVPFYIFAVEILVKNAQVAAAAFGAPGNGMAARQVGNTEVNDIVRSTIVATVALIIVSLICWGIAKICDWHTDIPTAGIVLVMLVSILLSVGIGYLMAKYSNKTFGFVNGDILGATNEIARAVILLIGLMIITMSLW